VNTSPAKLWRHAVQHGDGAAATQPPAPSVSDDNDGDDVDDDDAVADYRQLVTFHNASISLPK